MEVKRSQVRLPRAFSLTGLLTIRFFGIKSGYFRSRRTFLLAAQHFA